MNRSERKKEDQLLSSIDRKALYLLIVGGIITIIAFITMGFVIHINHEVEEIEHHSCPRHMISDDLSCTDFNPCTTDIKSRIPRSLNVSCPSSYQCEHFEKPNGSSCDQTDFCYYDNGDPKQCIDGACVSSDATRCKGYCTQDTDCQVTIPLTIDPYSATRYDFCAYSACVTQLIVFQVDVTNALSLLDTNSGNLENLNISGCLDALCQRYDDYYGGYTVCLYKWKCAPFINLGYFGNDGVARTTNRSHLFPLPGLWGKQYSHLSERLLNQTIEGISRIVKQQ